MDTNINNYSVDDILTIFNLKNTNALTISQINQVSNKLINKMNSENKSDLATFFKQAADKVIKSLNTGSDAVGNTGSNSLGDADNTDEDEDDEDEDDNEY